jgi:hypothetical protein
MSVNSWKPLHLFLYHKNDPATVANFERLCSEEGDSNIQPVSDCQSFLPSTFRADHGKWPFPHWDSYWMCDGLIYKYILNNKDRVMASSAVVINEYDTWWQCGSSEWMPQLMKNCDIAASNVLTFGKDGWVFFDKHKHLEFAKQLRGLVPFSVVCIRPETAIGIAEMVRDDTRFHPLYNNEMRIGSAANMLGARISPLPKHIGKNVQWHGCQYRDEPGIYHPIKNLVGKQKPKTLPNTTPNGHKRNIVRKNSSEKNKQERRSMESKDFCIFTCAFYGSNQRCLEAASRLRASVERFDCELKVFTGVSSSSLQDMKITRLIPLLEELKSKWLMWVDCGDTFCAQDPRRSLKYAKESGKKILMSAEKNCWPEGVFWTQYPVPKNNPDSMSHYRYLNSGVFVGLKNDVIDHLKMLEQIMEEDESLREPWRTDQAIWTRLFLNQDKYGASISLDTSCDLSVSTYGMPLEAFEPSRREGTPCVKIPDTGGKPIMLHFNGNDKHDVDKINKLIALSGGSACISKPSAPFDNQSNNSQLSFKRQIRKASPK